MKQFGFGLGLAFGLLATATPVPAPRPKAADSDVSISEADFNDIKFFAQYAGASYCNSEAPVGSVVTCAEDVCPDVTSAGAKVVATFHGDLTDVQGFVSSDDTNKLIVVSVKGSESVRNWIADLTFLKSDCDLVDDCRVHTGFLTGYNEIEDDLLAGVAAATAAQPSYKIVFTGHSLGGAVSTVAAGYARAKGYAVDLYTYGSPRVGNAEFADFITAQPGAEFRVTHLDDPVPRLPPLLIDYRHTSPEFWLSDGTSNQTEFSVADVKVCDGNANTDCNAGTSGLDIDAHLFYFEHISGCGQDGISFKRGVQPSMATTKPANITDEELLAKVNSWAEKDRKLAAGLKM
ncbi:alpha/beta-hydrolase [Hypomontagnella monticulosa]|nr:alpha/beta-hydrolase [Hypomontagnella monticulosa]